MSGMTLNIRSRSPLATQPSSRSSDYSSCDPGTPGAAPRSGSGLSHEREVARDSSNLAAELAHLKTICGDDDAELLTDMIEGETTVEAFVGKMIELIGADEADIDGIKAYQQKL